MFDFWKMKEISRECPGLRIFQIKWSLWPFNILTIVHELQMLWWKHGHRPWWFQEKHIFTVDYFLNISHKILGLKLVELWSFHRYSLPLKHSRNSNSDQKFFTPSVKSFLPPLSKVFYHPFTGWYINIGKMISDRITTCLREFVNITNLNMKWGKKLFKRG